MHKFKLKGRMNAGQTLVQFNHSDQSTLSNICRVAADKFEENAKMFGVIAEQPEGSHGFVTKQGAASLVDQFKRQAVEAREYADMFDAVLTMPDMVMDADEEEDAA